MLRFYQLLVDGTLPFDTLITLQTILIAFGISIIISIPVGIAMGRIRTVEYGMDPYITLVYATPTVVLIPLFIIWFGNNLTSSYLLATLHAVPPLVINTLIGVRVVNNTLVETGRSFGLQGTRLWRTIILPASLPYIMAGLRIAIGAAVIGTMVAEIFMFSTGLGYLLVYSASQFDSAAIISGVLVVMALGILLTEAVKYAQRRIAGWSLTATGIG